MPKFLVEFKGIAHYSVEVDVEDEEDAIEEAGKLPMPYLGPCCFGGKDRGFRLEIPDDPACWEGETVELKEGEIDGKR